MQPPIRGHFRTLGMTGPALATARISETAIAGWARQLETQIPIERLVVIFQESQSFPGSFATYSEAGNPVGGTPPPLACPRSSDPIEEI